MANTNEIKEAIQRHYCKIETRCDYEGLTTTRIVNWKGRRFLYIMNNGDIEEIHPLAEV